MKFISLLIALLFISGKAAANNQENLNGMFASEVRALAGKPLEIHHNSLKNKSIWYYPKFYLEIAEDKVINTNTYKKVSSSKISANSAEETAAKIEDETPSQQAKAVKTDRTAMGLLQPLDKIDQQQLTDILKETEEKGPGQNDGENEAGVLTEGTGKMSKADEIRAKMQKMREQREQMGK